MVAAGQHVVSSMKSESATSLVLYIRIVHVVVSKSWYSDSRGAPLLNINIGR